MQERTQPESVQMFEWRSSSDRLMCVIHGFPMYRSSGKNSRFKDSWFPCLGISGTRWIRKPGDIGFPEDVVQFCKQLELDKKFTLKRFGNINTLCISASLGEGIWNIDEGIKLKHYLAINYPSYFLTDEELKLILELQNENQHQIISDVATANSYLKKYGSWVFVDFYGRLPEENEYLFFLKTSNKKIHTALSMLLMRNKQITNLTFNVIQKLAENENLLDYAISFGLLDTQKNLKNLTRLLLIKRNITLDDLIGINPLHKIRPPIGYEILLQKYSCRRIFRQLINFSFTERDFSLLKELNDIQLLNRYGKLFIDDESRQVLFLFQDNRQLNYKMIRIVWEDYKATLLKKDITNPLEDDFFVKDLNSYVHLLRANGLFAKEKIVAQTKEAENTLSIGKRAIM